MKSSFPYKDVSPTKVWIYADHFELTMMDLHEELPYISQDPFEEVSYFDDLYYESLFKHVPNDFKSRFGNPNNCDLQNLEEMDMDSID